MIKGQDYSIAPVRQFKQHKEIMTIKKWSTLNIQKFLIIQEKSLDTEVARAPAQWWEVLVYLSLMFRFRVPKSYSGKSPFHRIPGNKDRRRQY